MIDASVAIKWVVEEHGTPEALILRQRAKLIAPELLAVECANVLWKKVQRDELSNEQAFLAARLIHAANIEIVSTFTLLEAATRLAVELDHPAYDCVNLALALKRDCLFATADERFVRKIGELRRFRRRLVTLAEAAGE